MNAVTKHEPKENHIADFGGSLLNVIASAARDPNVDIDKMERLIAMQERIHSRDAEGAFNAAMAAAQAEMRPVSADANNPQTRSNYASYAQLDRAIRPIYTAHGFALTFDEGDTDKPDHVRVLCYVSHTGGFSRTYKRDMPADGKGAKGGDVMTKTHAVGAAGSYGARYLLKGIFNIAVGEDDRDGNGEPEYINDRQVRTIQDLIDQHGLNVARFCNYMNVPNVPALLSSNYHNAIAAINATIAANAKRAAETADA